ncbi:radical SAM protein [Desulfovibrio falkowii]|uniref:Radical SAM protein n=1 Tax=Desulfovibrio falkowii TaxID=3136602 RepID=A0ABQ0EAS9_9BACT
MGEKKASRYPRIFAIETVLGCNLSCPECAVGGGLIERKYGRLSYSDFVKIFEKIRKHCEYLYLHLWGEPMLNPEIIKMIEHASRFTKTNISTNANTLTENGIKDLVASGVTDIIVSIDGMSQDCYSIYRKGGDVSRALQSLSLLVAYAGTGSPSKLQKIFQKIGVTKRKPQIIPQYVVFEHNQGEMDAFKEYCANINVTPMFKAPYIRKDSQFSLSDNPLYQRAIEQNLAKRKLAMKCCTDMVETFTILLDGSVVACCYDHNGLTTFGNIFEQSVEEICQSEAYQKFCAARAAGRTPAFCIEHCLVY